MLKPLIKPIYRFTHDLLNACSPLWAYPLAGRPVKWGHISAEHLQDPSLDEELARTFGSMGIAVEPYYIPEAAYRQYLREVTYPDSYYGGGRDPKANFTEKSLEHFVSLQFLQLNAHSVFVDIAACNSPFHQIVRQYLGVRTTYQQDLIYPPGIHGHRIGGYADKLYLPDESVDAVTLHCSLEHFEGEGDTAFFRELQRVLRPGGRAVVLPFYLAHTYTLHIDPAYNLLKGHRPGLDPQAQLRYCSWYQFFSRHYDPPALQRRILQQAPALRLSLYRVMNFRQIDARCYLRWVGVFEKRAE